MASFTDAISQFNPYVQQLPIEAMREVGLYKQAKYDEGVQKIQSYIDTVSGLDIVHPEDRKYLESKLNEASGTLGAFAVADFSNAQLTNSLAGMVGKIAKDSRIKNAIVSTKNMRAGDAELEDALKAGKSSPVNQADWAEKKSKWLSNPNAPLFSDRYIQYRDLDKKLREVGKEVPEVENEYDNPYQTDSQGNTLYYDRNGNLTTADRGTPKLAPVMQRIKIKGKDSKKILDNFLSSLDDNDMQQLQLDAKYHYSGVTKENFLKDMVEAASSEKNRISETVTSLQQTLATNSKLTSAQKEEIQSQINVLNNKLSSGEIDKDLKRQLDDVNSVDDFEKYKKSIYIKKYLGDKANAISYESKKSSIQNNPYMDYQIKVENLALQKQKVANQLTYYRKKLELAEKKAVDKIATTADEVLGTDDYISTDEKIPALSDLTNKANALKTDADKYMIDKYYDLFPSDKGVNITPEQKLRKFQNLYQEFNASPNENISPRQAKILNNYRAKYNEYTDQVAFNDYIIKESEKKFDDLSEKTLKDNPTLKIKGEQYNTEDLLHIYNIMKKIPGMGESPSSHYSPYSSPIYDENKIINSIVDPNLKKVAQKIAKYSSMTLEGNYGGFAELDRTVGELYGDVSKKVNESERDLIASLDPSIQSRSGNLSLEKIKGKPSPWQAPVMEVIGSTLQNYDQNKLGADVEKSDQIDYESLRLAKPDNINVRIKRTGDGSGELMITVNTGKDKSTTSVIPMNYERMSQLFPQLQGNLYAEDLRRKIHMGGGTTNQAGITDGSVGAATAKFTGDQLPLVTGTPLANIVKYDIEASPDNSGDSDSDSYIVRLYAYDNKAHLWKSDYIGTDYLSIDKIPYMLERISENTIKDILKKP